MTPGGAVPIDWGAVSRRSAPVAVVLLGLAWVGAFFAGASRPEPDLTPFLRRAFPGARIETTSPGVFAAHRDGVLVGYATAGTADGYSGPVSVGVATGPDGRIRALALLEHRDTPAIVALGPAPSAVAPRHVPGRAPSGSATTSTPSPEPPRPRVASPSRPGPGSTPLPGTLSPARRRSTGAWRSVLPRCVLLALLVVAAVGKNHPWVPSRRRRLLRFCDPPREPRGSRLPVRPALGHRLPDPPALGRLALLENAPVLVRPSRRHAADLLPRPARARTAPGCAPSARPRTCSALVGGGHRRHLPRPLLFAWVKGALLVAGGAPGPRLPQSGAGELRGLRDLLPSLRHRPPDRRARRRRPGRRLLPAALLPLGVSDRRRRARAPPACDGGCVPGGRRRPRSADAAGRSPSRPAHPLRSSDACARGCWWRPACCVRRSSSSTSPRRSPTRAGAASRGSWGPRSSPWSLPGSRIAAIAGMLRRSPP